MENSTKESNGVAVQMEVQPAGRHIEMPNLPRPLTLEEKRYLLAVERGDLAAVRRMLQRAEISHSFNVNCVDPLGRGALTLAIDNENLEMVQLLVVMRVRTGDALLIAIEAGFVEAVELLLEYEELVHKDGEPYSWEKVDWNVATYTPDITPLILAAHRNNYEILKILLDRGATLPMPHDVKCGCENCLRALREDSLRHSAARLSEYRALASPSLMALSSTDPLLTAFQLSWELRDLATAEPECRAEYLELRAQCQQFAVDLLHHSRSSTELAVVLNHDPNSPPYEDGEHMKLARLELAILYKQKRFVAHPKVQQLLASLWYEGLPGFRRKGLAGKCKDLVQIALLFPFYCVMYMVVPNSGLGKHIRKPFIKFLVHASSYLFFLLILILVSQRFEMKVMELVGWADIDEIQRKQRGNPPTPLEWLVVVYVLGFIWEETAEMLREGMKRYLRNMWNFIDFSRNMLYVMVFMFRGAAYIQQRSQLAADPNSAYVPREQWNDFDPQLIADGFFAGANILSALKLIHLFSINPHLGPLQISLGRMVNDIVKFLFIYSLVLFAFACGMNQLLWYFAELERNKCFSFPGGMPDWDGNADSCTKWRSFANLFEASQSLFWASFGNVGIDSFELTGIKSYTRFWGLLMFGSYSVINIIVLLNLLIAMMSNSYAMIEQRSDTEWKFARTRLWMSYFEQGATLPPPFNIMPTPKRILRLLGIRTKSGLRRMSTKRKERQEKERDFRYTAVMRALVWRYISASHRACVEAPVTEDDVNEIKGDISSLRCDLLEVLGRCGVDVSVVQRGDKNAGGRRMRVWERRLLKDFHVAPLATEDEQLVMAPPPENETSLQRFRRVAKLAVLQSSTQRWRQVMQGISRASQIGRCHNRESFMNQQNLQRAMEEARRMVDGRAAAAANSPRGISPMPPFPSTSRNILELLRDDHDGNSNQDFPRETPEPGPVFPFLGNSPEPAPLKSGRSGSTRTPPRIFKKKPVAQREPDTVDNTVESVAPRSCTPTRADPLASPEVEATPSPASSGTPSPTPSPVPHTSSPELPPPLPQVIPPPDIATPSPTSTPRSPSPTASVTGITDPTSKTRAFSTLVVDPSPTEAGPSSTSSSTERLVTPAPYTDGRSTPPSLAPVPRSSDVKTIKRVTGGTWF